MSGIGLGSIYGILVVSLSAIHGCLRAQGALQVNRPLLQNGDLGELFIGRMTLDFNVDQISFITLEFSLNDSSGNPVIAVEVNLKGSDLNTLGVVSFNRVFFHSHTCRVIYGKENLHHGRVIRINPGNYTIQVAARVQAAGVEYALSGLTNWELAAPFHGRSTANPGSGNKVSSQGNAETGFRWSNMVPEGSEIPNFLMDFNGAPRFSIYGVPVSARLMISSMNGASLQNMNIMSINFDGSRLIEEFKSRILGGQMISNRIVQEGVGRDRLLLREYESRKQALMKTGKDSLEKHTNYNRIVELDSLRSRLDSLGNSLVSQSPDLSPLDVNDSIMAIDTLWQSIALREKMLEDSLSSAGITPAKLEALRQDLKRMRELDAYLSEQYPNFDTPGFSLPSTDKLNQAGAEQKLAGWVRALGFIKTLGVGSVFPTFSNYTLHGQRLDGVEVGIGSEQLIFRYTRGRVFQSAFSEMISTASYTRNLQAFQIGVGSSQNSHLKFTFVEGADDASSINPRDSIYEYHVLPQRNRVLSVSATGYLMNRKIWISGEVAGSSTILDTEFSGAGNGAWVEQIFTQSGNEESRVGLTTAGELGFDLRKLHSEVVLKYRRVAPGFRSFGLPFLQADLEETGVTIRKSLKSIGLRLSGQFSHTRDNLLGTKGHTTHRILAGGDIALQRKDWPWIQISYRPLQMGVDTLTFFMHSVNGQVSYPFKIRKKPSTLTGMFTYQQTEGNLPALDYYFMQGGLNLEVQFSRKAYGLAGFGYLQQLAAQAETLDGMRSEVSGGIVWKRFSVDGGVHTLIQPRADWLLGGSLQFRWDFHPNLYWTNRVEYNGYQVINPLVLNHFMNGFLSLALRSSFGINW